MGGKLFLDWRFYVCRDSGSSRCGLARLRPRIRLGKLFMGSTTGNTPS